MSRFSFLVLVLFTAFSVQLSAADMVLETKSFRITITELCIEGEIGCSNVEYKGVNKKSGASIFLNGTTYMVKCADGVTPCHVGRYEFTNSDTHYYVYPSGQLEVVKAQKVLVSEQGEWQ